MNNYFWQADEETMSQSIRQTLQLYRLQHLLGYLNQRVSFYRERFKGMEGDAINIRSLAELARYPFTVKTDLRDYYPFGLFAAPEEEIVRLHASSGTTGKPIVVAYTRQDIALWSDAMARTLCAGGIDARDIIQIAYGYGLFTGGLGVHYGAERLGATVVPISGGNTAKQLTILQDFGTTALACTPSYSIYMAEEGQNLGLDFERCKVKVGFFGAEPWSEKMRRQIEAIWHIKALDIYGLSEIIGPGVAFECEYQNGLHVNEDHFYPEIINPVTGDILPDGEVGELVFTTLTKQGIPLLRYRTRDLTCIIPEPCPCGRTLRRIARIMGRSDDMIIIRGVNVFPSQIEEILLNIEGTEPHYVLIIDREKSLDTLEVQVELNEKFFSDEIRKLEVFQQLIRDRIHAVTGIHAAIKLVAPHTIQRSEGKAKRVIDRRGQ